MSHQQTAASKQLMAKRSSIKKPVYTEPLEQKKNLKKATFIIPTIRPIPTFAGARSRVRKNASAAECRTRSRSAPCARGSTPFARTFRLTTAHSLRKSVHYRALVTRRPNQSARKPLTQRKRRGDSRDQMHKSIAKNCRHVRLGRFENGRGW